MLFTAALSVVALAAPALASDAWTVNCNPLTIQRSDPILSPGVASGHVHAVVGGTAFQRTMGNDTARNAHNTTCNKYTDHSNYWCPQLYSINADSTFSMVPFTGANFYYENYTCDYNSSTNICPEIRNPRAFPEGFRMLGGSSVRRTFNASDVTNLAVNFISGSQYNVHYLPTEWSTELTASVRFPSCFDGRLDSPDHVSHVAYPTDAYGGDGTQGGMCPQSHPYALINIGSEFGFDLTLYTNMSLVFANGDTTGYGFHADFIQGWENSTALQQSFANCFTDTDCPWRAFGSPTGQDIQPTTFQPEVPAIYEEDIGLHNPIAKLPGNNSVYVKPASS